MADRSLDPEQFAALEVHIDECSQCRRAIGAFVAGRSLAHGTTAGDEIEPLAAFIDSSINGRYSILSELGEGGMGTVYLAHDRMLDREVALKVHRAGSGNDRLHREAIAMAKLAHPNVVTVFEIGSVDDRLYVAMEYVRGQTLRGWLMAGERSWREIVQMLVLAGQGLAAAHAAGLVHRDFKPENVLVGDDGRPRVSDFGLARVGSAARSSRPLAASPTGPLTMTGALMGTPAYMAPEQIDGDAVDARCDQFAFCVVAWECLFGERPFAGATLIAVHEAIAKHEVQEPKRGDVPPRVREVIERGLAMDPAQRYADMQALLTALRTAAAPRTKRRRLIAAAVAGAVLLAGSVGIAARSSDSGPTCATGEKRLAGVWDAARKRAVTDAIIATKTSYARSVALHVVRDLDNYTNAWSAMYLEACEATNVRGEQSYVLLDRRMECLDRRRVQLNAIVDVLAHADASVVEKATRAVRALPTLDGCADRDALLAAIPPPDNQTTRKRVEELRREIAAVEALRGAGKYKEGLARAKPLAEAARNLGYRPLIAEAVYSLGLLQDSLGDSRTAEVTFYEAVHAAEAARDLDTSAQIWSTLVNTVGYRLDRADEAERLLDKMADAAVERAGRPARLEWRRVRSLANVRVKQGRYDEARELFSRAAALAAQVHGPDDPFVIRLHEAEGQQLETLGHFDEALKRYENALHSLERVQGADHPDLANTYENIGVVKGRMGHHEEALAALDKARAIAEHAYGPEHPSVAEIISETGLAYIEHEDAEHALPLLRRAAEIAEKVEGPEHTHTLDYLGQVAIALKRLGKVDEAFHLLERVSKLEENVRGPEHPRLAATLQNLGGLAFVRHQPAQALALHERALHVFEKVYGAKSERVISALLAKSSALRELGRAAEAAAAAQQAMTAIGDRDSPLRAHAYYILARALWNQGQRARALQLARTARDAYAAAGGESGYSEEEPVESWLAAHEPKR